MTRWEARTFRFLPALLEQTLLAEAHEQRIERARAEAGFFGQVIAMAPLSGTLQQGGQQGASLTRIVGLARHDNIQHM